jgi:hypothetical protein|tara:strand:- start:132 stop:455 length:324 start_codon:yes stop_codon:yes gene_type:complete
MGKLLETRLPIALNEVDAGVYNRMVRILEINLDRFDTTATPEYNDTELNQNQFNAGDVIWNTNKSVLQVYTGNKWQDISTRTEVGLAATGSVGSLTVSVNGATEIAL